MKKPVLRMLVITLVIVVVSIVLFVALTPPMRDMYMNAFRQIF